MLLLSITAAVAATATARQLAGRLGEWNSALAGVAAYLTVITAAMLILPPVNEVPAGFPAATLWDFRVASLGSEAVLWMPLGLIFGVLAERRLIAPPSRGTRRLMTASQSLKTRA
jgi:predicted cobalt transporter CbtA